MTTTLENGCIVIPQELLEELGVQDGTRFEVHRDGGQLILVPTGADVEAYLESLAGAWLDDGDDDQGLERLIAARQEDRARVSLPLPLSPPRPPPIPDNMSQK